MKTFDLFDDKEKQYLRDINPAAESIVNNLGVNITEEKLFPFRPLGRNEFDQGTEKPIIFGKHEVVTDNGCGFVTMCHPQDSSFSKTERRKGIIARVKKNYFHPEWKTIVKALMPKGVAKMRWAIYPHSNGVAHLYLETALPSPDGRGIVSLYVPTEYFRTGDWSVVENFHNAVAVGYYNGKGFNQPPEKLQEWREQTAAALTSKEAKKLRRLVKKSLDK